MRLLQQWRQLGQLYLAAAGGDGACLRRVSGSIAVIPVVFSAADANGAAERLEAGARTDA